MLPLPAATTTLTNTLVTSQPVFDAFKPYGFFELGVIIAAVVILFLVATFRDGLTKLLFHHSDSKFDNK